jgi:hypothetical protein
VRVLFDKMMLDLPSVVVARTITCVFAFHEMGKRLIVPFTPFRRL